MPKFLPINPIEDWKRRKKKDRGRESGSILVQSRVTGIFFLLRDAYNEKILIK